MNIEPTYIPIGFRCRVIQYLIVNNKRRLAYPFDSIYASLDVVKHCIETRFAEFLNKDQYRTYPHCSETRTHHGLYDKMNLEDVMMAKCYASTDGINNVPFTTFVHHDLCNDDIYKAFQRRCERFMTAIESASEESRVELMLVCEFLNTEEMAHYYATQIKNFKEFVSCISPHIQVTTYINDRSSDTMTLYA